MDAFDVAMVAFLWVLVLIGLVLAMFLLAIVREIWKNS